MPFIYYTIWTIECWGCNFLISSPLLKVLLNWIKLYKARIRIWLYIHVEENFTPSEWEHVPAPWWNETCCTVVEGVILLFLCHYRNCLHQHLTASPGYGSVHLLLLLHTSASEASPNTTLSHRHTPSPESQHALHPGHRSSSSDPWSESIRKISHPIRCWGWDVLSPLLASKHSEHRWNGQMGM